VFLPRFDFHLGADHLSSNDARFVWDANFGGNMDLVDYGHGRATFSANYEAVLGEEFRSFDPNQGTYLLDTSSSLRGHGFEVAAVFHHTSRHLSDRFKRAAIDWNMLGVKVEHDLIGRSTKLRAYGDVLDVLLKSTVDYTREANGGLQLRVPLRPHLSVISDGNVRIVGVDGSRNRGTQQGGRVEGGLRFEGERGAIDVFVARERRIDASPIDFSAVSCFSAGFRFVSR
jgi:hypothetical protein